MWGGWVDKVVGVGKEEKGMGECCSQVNNAVRGVRQSVTQGDESERTDLLAQLLLTTRFTSRMTT